MSPVIGMKKICTSTTKHAPWNGSELSYSAEMKILLNSTVELKHSYKLVLRQHSTKRTSLDDRPSEQTEYLAKKSEQTKPVFFLV